MAEPSDAPAGAAADSAAPAPGAAQHAPEEGGPNIDFNDVFSLRKPRDARAGLSSGLKSIAKGVVGGAAGLIAAPIVGAQREGVTGFAKGLASGVVGAVVLPATGVSVGAVQMVRGVINTPEAIKQTTAGKLWDEDRREWVEKDAIVLVEPPGGAGGGGAGGKGRGGGGFARPKSGDDYYAILQVPRDATPDQIKKAYYMLARKYHPDKNAGDASAHEKFQKLGEAYQVLGNEELRARYDEHGADGLDVNFMDGGSFFAMLFGSDQFEHLVGELFIAMAARCGGELGTAGMAREQGVRVQKLCVNLKAILKRYVEGDEEGFALAMRDEASRLVTASFGETMLHTIGKVYDMQADIIAGGFFGGMAAKFRSQGETMKSQFQAASAAVKVYQAQQRIEAWQKEQERRAAAAAPSGPTIEELMERQRLEEAALPLMLEAMWAANVLDIQATLKKVCRFVLTEQGVAKQELQARANALKVLGGIFLEAHAPESATPADARAQMEEAMLRVVEKRAQAEGGGAGGEEEEGAHAAGAGAARH